MSELSKEEVQKLVDSNFVKMYNLLCKIIDTGINPHVVEEIENLLDDIEGN